MNLKKEITFCRPNKMNLNSLLTRFLRKQKEMLNPIIKRLLALMGTNGCKLNSKDISLVKISNPINDRFLKAIMTEIPMKNSSMCQNRAVIIQQMRFLNQINPNNLRITSLRRQNMKNKCMFQRRIKESFGMKNSNSVQIKRQSIDLILL